MPSEENSALLDRRTFLSGLSLTLAAFASSSVVRGRFAYAQPAITETVEVKTAYGRLRGTRRGDLINFKGIPYAGQVSGENRFKAPPPLAPWTGVRDAFTPRPPSFQPGKTYFGIDEPVPSENCLVRNVWTPAVDQRRRPVMFYNHGGGFTAGCGRAHRHGPGPGKGRAEHERNVDHVRENRLPRRQRATDLAHLHTAKARDDDDRCAMQS